MSLELELVREQLGKKKGSLITQGVVDELNSLIENPDYGEEFLDSYVSYFNVLEKNSSWSTPKYMNAVKFFTLMESGHNATDAYVKVFPERLAARQARNESKGHMGGEASRYNASQLVNEVRKVATIPVTLIHRHLLHEAILKTARMMNDPDVSAAVQQKAAETLIRELKPVEKAELSIEVKNESSVIDELRRATEELVIEQMRSIQAGTAVKHIAESRVLDVVEAEVE